jgi:putative phage-type endonuclease
MMVSSMTILTTEQRTADWFTARTGKVTASRVKDVLAKLKNGKPGAERERYLWELVAERLTGQATRHFQNAAMSHGVEYEINARIEYEFRTSEPVRETGFCIHRTYDDFGCSPDGLVGDYGLVEIKCPFNPGVHLQTLLAGEMPAEHMPQIQAQLAVMGREWCDFVSFYPHMPDSVNCFIKRVDRDEKYIDAMLAEIGAFLEEVADTVKRVEGLGVRK